MSRPTPSLLALLGLVAVAGYQNRDRLGELLSEARKTAQTSTGQAPSGNDPQSGLGAFFRTGSGSSVAAAVSDLVGRFRDAGRGATAETWVSKGPNAPLDVKDLETALGPETLEELSQKTGLSQSEILLRLNVALPEAVDHLTPEGRLPFPGEA